MLTCKSAHAADVLTRAYQDAFGTVPPAKTFRILRLQCADSMAALVLRGPIEYIFQSFQYRVEFLGPAHVSS
jgi:hypothetical protein